MEFTLGRLQRDVMVRLGEIACLQSSSLPAPGPAEVMAMKVESLLPTVGAKLIVEASLEMLEGGSDEEVEAEYRQMPCGMLAAEVSLPEDLLRLVSVKMESWSRPAVRLILPGMAEWECQWSEEEGIAGCPERPRAYLEGHVLRAVGIRGAQEMPVSIRSWRIPRPDADGRFEYPAKLYAHLVDRMAAVAGGEPG